MNNRIAYILLAVFLGALGIHNFYAGRIKIGMIQLLITLIGGFFTVGIAAFAVGIWAIYEAITVKTNGSGEPFTI